MRLIIKSDQSVTGVNESRQHTSSLKYNGYIFINHNTIMDREDDHFCLNGLSRRRAA
ncbi:hypothetical [Yersinia pestis KIM10+]|uniref:Uncharacterized protein n=1 Tax=Yersinia pestis TaxID=632 RepID=Q8CKY7_YERPE|nr:hypothetical [Yersinia pestis KIM10+]